MQIFRVHNIIPSLPPSLPPDRPPARPLALPPANSTRPTPSSEINGEWNERQPTLPLSEIIHLNESVIKRTPLLNPVKLIRFERSIERNFSLFFPHLLLYLLFERERKRDNVEYLRYGVQIPNGQTQTGRPCFSLDDNIDIKREGISPVLTRDFVLAMNE